jgi:hypothetical protein
MSDVPTLSFNQEDVRVSWISSLLASIVFDNLNYRSLHSV